MDMNRALRILAPVALVLFAACGGSSHPKATKLVYTDPEAAPAGWRLVADAASTPTHLVLDLVGPSDGTKYRGVGFTLQADPKKVKFAKVLDAEGNLLGYHVDGGVFQDKDPDGTAQPVTLQASGVREDKLMVGIFQRKDDDGFGEAGSTAKDCSGVVLRIAVDLDPALNAGTGSVPLTVLKARTIREHVNADKRRMNDIQVSVGTLKLE